MVADKEGFPHPEINQKLCIDCGACVKVCPALNEPKRRNSAFESRFFAAYHKDEAIRMASSSGGVFSAFASWMLKKGGCVCAAAYDENFRGVHHVIIHKEEEIAQLRTSKYTQSRMEDCFVQIRTLLQKGKDILFVGTPCQTAGLHLFLKKAYPGLLTMDILCHGVPSPSVFRDYMDVLEQEQGDRIIHYNFRDKKWSWFHFNTKAVFSSGRIYRGTWEEDVFMRGFLRDYFLRKSCYSCRYSTYERHSDLTVSDFWGYSEKDGGFRNEDKGISMCMCNTLTGYEAFQNIENQIIWCARPRKMSLINGAFSKKAATLEEREQFLSDYRKKGFKQIIPKYMYPEKIGKELKCIYLFGRESFILKIYRSFRTLIRKIRGA